MRLLTETTRPVSPEVIVQLLRELLAGADFEGLRFILKGCQTLAGGRRQVHHRFGQHWIRILKGCQTPAFWHPFRVQSDAIHRSGGGAALTTG